MVKVGILGLVRAYFIMFGGPTQTTALLEMGPGFGESFGGMI